MGACFSTDGSDPESAPPPTAKVVSFNGGLHEYNLPLFVSDVLQAEFPSSSSASSNFFLCNSDGLSYDEFIPALDFDEQLQPDQIYFVLPISNLQHRLSSKGMAAMAVKASVAIQNAPKKDSHRRKKNRISPVLLVAQGAPPVVRDKVYDDTPTKIKPYQKPAAVPLAAGFSRSGSVRRLQKYTSKRARLAVRSFKLRLSTIYEGSVL